MRSFSFFIFGCFTFWCVKKWYGYSEMNLLFVNNKSIATETVIGQCEFKNTQVYVLSEN